jgi:hypothetical protein
VIRTVSNIDECKVLWDQFSPCEGPWDDWELMLAFHDERLHAFHFMVHETNGEADGMVPLVHDTLNNRFMLIGGSYPDGRVLWLKHEHFPAFFDACPDRTVLFDIDGTWADAVLAAHPQYEVNATETDQRFFLVPAAFDYDFTNHINTFSPDRRQNFLYDLRNIRKRNPVLRWSDDDETELFVDLCNRNFGAESDYATDTGKQEVQRVVRELRHSGRLRTLSIEIDGVKQGVSLSLLQGKTMIALYAAGNGDFNNLGKLVNFETIQEGCCLRVDEISYMTGMQWKANWKMNAQPVRTFRKPPAPW